MKYFEENGTYSSSICCLKELLKDRKNFADDQSYEIAKEIVSNYDWESICNEIIINGWKED